MKKYLPALNTKRALFKILLPAFVIVALVNLALVPFVFNHANAGTLTPAKLTISSARASGAGGGTAVTYNFAFTLTANTAVKQWTIKFCTSSDTSGSCTTPTGIITTSAVNAADNFSAGVGGRTEDFTVNGTLTSVVDTPAGTEVTQAKTISYTTITNPSTQNAAFYAWVTTYSDSGSTVLDGPTAVAAATLANTAITASATVDSTFSFSVAGTAPATVVAGNQSTDVTTTTTTIPFGTLVADTVKTAATNLVIATNATNGYTVTVAASNPPLIDGAKNIDLFSAGSNATPVAWLNATNNPTGTTPSVNTGFFGYTTSDSSLSGTATRFTASNNLWAGSDLATPAEVAYSAGSTAGAGDAVRVGWRAEVDSYQPNGNYTGIISLIATPTF